MLGSQWPCHERHGSSYVGIHRTFVNPLRVIFLCVIVS